MAKPRRSYALWVLGIVIRALLGLLLFSLCAFLAWRVFFSTRLPREMKSLAVNNTLREAYEEAGTLTMFTQEQASVTRVDGYNYGYFGVPRFVFIEEAGQAQVVFRYNNSTLENIQKDLGLENTPERGVEIFDISLVLVSGEDPDDGDTLTRTRVSPSSVSVDTTALYTYFLYTFDGVNIKEDTYLIDLDVYYPAGAPDYEDEARGTLRLYDYELEKLPVKLKASEKKALRKGAEE